MKRLVRTLLACILLPCTATTKAQDYRSATNLGPITPRTPVMVRDAINSVPAPASAFDGPKAERTAILAVDFTVASAVSQAAMTRPEGSMPDAAALFASAHPVGFEENTGQVRTTDGKPAPFVRPRMASARR